MARDKKGFYVRLADEEISAITLLSNYRGETREQTVLAAVRVLAEQTFAEEIKTGHDFPLQKLPVEIRLSDVLRILGVK